MKKLISFSLLLVAGVLLTGKAEAVGVRGPKTSTALIGNVNVVGVSTGSAAVYAVILGTGAVTDFVTLFDSNSAVGLTSTNQTNGGYKGRFYAASATANTQVTFDPPLQFNNGVMATNATTVMTSVIVYEKGRPAGQGY